MNEVVIVKLAHDEYEKEVDSIICDLVDESIFLYVENERGPKCHEGATYESSLFKNLQFVVSFLPAERNPELAKVFSIGHVSRKKVERVSKAQLPDKFYLTGLALAVLEGLDHPIAREEMMSYNEATPSPYYVELMELVDQFDLERVLKEIRGWRDNPEIFDYYIDLGKRVSDLFLLWIKETDIVPLDVNEIYDLLEEMTPGNPNILETFHNLRWMIVDLRDETTVKYIQSLAKEGKYNKFVLLVGSAHAKGIANRLDKDDFHVEIVEKYDMDSLIREMNRLRNL